MQTPPARTDRPGLGQFGRFVVNGLFAACVHFALLTLNLKVLGMPSAGLANFVAAIGGTTASFFGCRYYVFRAVRQPMLAQAAGFGGVYLLTAIVHGGVLYAWTDLAHLDYRIGFLLATLLAMILTYLGNKRLVFRPDAGPTQP